MTGAVAPRTRLYIAAAMAAPRVGEWLFAKKQAPGVIPYALSLLVATMGVFPNGEVADRRAMAWPPHRPRPTPKRYRNGQSDGLVLGVKFGRVEYVDRARVGGLRP